tara:strand:+ start:1396 stop:1830 length:435 start_codon:yes stop_codon:yes gene_type:complete
VYNPAKNNNIIYSGGIGGPANINNIIYNMPAVNANIIYNNNKNNSAKYNNINTRNNKVSDYIIRIRPIYNKKINNLINNPAIKYIKYSGIIRIGLNTIKNINNKIGRIGLKAINNIKGIRPIKIPANINNKLYRLGQYIKFKNN